MIDGVRVFKSSPVGVVVGGEVARRDIVGTCSQGHIILKSAVLARWATGLVSVLVVLVVLVLPPVAAPRVLVSGILVSVVVSLLRRRVPLLTRLLIARRLWLRWLIVLVRRLIVSRGVGLTAHVDCKMLVDW